MRPVLARMLTLLISFLLSVVLLEGSLRVATPETLGQRPFSVLPFIRLDPIFGWRNLPNVETAEAFGRAVQIGTNALGFRGPELAREKPKGSLRVFCLGDSGTFGWWRKTDLPNPQFGPENYPAELAGLLRELGRSEIEVVNAGVLGHSSAHGLRALILNILDLEPDVVTVRYGFNDHSPAWRPGARALEPQNPIVRALFYGTAGLRTTRLAWMGYTSTPWFHPKPKSVPWVTRAAFGANLRRFAELARSEGFELLFIDYPMSSTSHVTPSTVTRMTQMLGSPRRMFAQHAAYQQVMRGVARDADVPVIETIERVAGDEAAFFSRLDMVHPSRDGARLIAELLLERLDELGWLDAP